MGSASVAYVARDGQLVDRAWASGRETGKRLLKTEIAATGSWCGRAAQPDFTAIGESVAPLLRELFARVFPQSSP